MDEITFIKRIIVGFIIWFTDLYDYSPFIILLITSVQDEYIKLLIT